MRFKIDSAEFNDALSAAKEVWALGHERQWTRGQMLLVGYILIYASDASALSRERLVAFVQKASAGMQEFLRVPS